MGNCAMAKRTNLLENRVVGGLLGARWFPIAAQVGLLGAFGLLIWGGWLITTDDAKFAKTLRNTNLANLLVWSYWWPLVIVAAVLLGRAWCTVCPMELVTAVCAKIGLRRRAPRFLKSGWVITAFYALVVLVGIHRLAIHRIPHRMALYMLVLLGIAALVSLVFEKRAFCSYVCPVGHLLGLYAHCGVLEWGSADEAKCKECKTKDCIAKENHYKLIGRSCTSNLYPATIRNSRDCLLCTQCQKACPNDNLRLSVRWPFADFFRPLKLRAAEVGFVLLVSGFVVYEILSEWDPSKACVKWAPNQVVGWLGATGPLGGFVSAVVMFVVLPAALFAVVVGLSKLLGAPSVAAAASSFALMLLPTMAGAHLTKAIFKMISRIPYWPHVLSDPAGVATATKIAVQKTVVLDKAIPEALFPATSWAAAVILLAALAAVVLIFARSPALRRQKALARIPLLLGALAYWAVFGGTILLWRFL